MLSIRWTFVKHIVKICMFNIWYSEHMLNIRCNFTCVQYTQLTYYWKNTFKFLGERSDVLSIWLNIKLFKEKCDMKKEQYYISEKRVSIHVCNIFLLIKCLIVIRKQVNQIKRKIYLSGISIFTWFLSFRITIFFLQYYSHNLQNT